MTNMTDQISVRLARVDLVLPHDDWREMHAIYTRWVHDANCQYLADFCTQGSKMRPMVLNKMGMRLEHAIEKANKEAQDTLTALDDVNLTDELKRVCRALDAAKKQRKTDSARFKELYDKHYDPMRIMLRKIEDFEKEIGAEPCVDPS